MAGMPTGGFSLRPPVPLPGSQIKVLVLVGLAFLIAGYDINLLGLVLPKVSHEFGLELGNEGEIIMWARLGVLLAFPLAMLADRFGRRAILMVTILGSAVTTLATAFAQNEEQFILLQGAVRMFGYAQDMISIVVIAEEMDDRARGWALGLLAASAAVGGGLSALVFAGVDILPFGWRGLYVLGAIPIFAIAWAWRGMPETRRFKELQAAEKPKDGPSGLNVALANMYSLVVTHGRRFWALIAVTAPLAFGVTCASVLLPTFLQSDLHLEPGYVTLIFVGGGLFGLFGNFIAGRYADKHGRKPVFLFASVGFVAAMALLYLGPHNLVVITICWGIAVFAFFAMEVVVGAWSAELFPTEQRSTASGARLATNIIFGGAALLLQTFLYGPLGGHATSIAALLPAILVATVIAMLFIPETAGKTLEQIAAEGEHKH
ncbi:Sialic acid transporter NanT [Alphaproteobacteria bacterium SO-S41]|nr:Sialic acid transporter NanT [Alphaproteobacteria bacterium SO-S41]